MRRDQSGARRRTWQDVSAPRENWRCASGQEFCQENFHTTHLHGARPHRSRCADAGERVGQTLPRMLKSPLVINIDWRTGKGACTNSSTRRNDKKEAAECILSAAVAGAGRSSRTVIAFQDARAKGVVKASGRPVAAGHDRADGRGGRCARRRRNYAAVFCDGTRFASSASGVRRSESPSTIKRRR